jgi:hypothetical protein
VWCKYKCKAHKRPKRNKAHEKECKGARKEKLNFDFDDDDDDDGGKVKLKCGGDCSMDGKSNLPIKPDSSSPDFLRHVQAALKRHRPLGTIYSLFSSIFHLLGLGFLI